MNDQSGWRIPRSPLDYFVYPYVEVNGQPLPKENFTLKFDYADK